MSAFDTFRQDRIREAKNGYTIVMGEKVTLKELYKAWTRWAVTNNVKKVNIKDFETLCEDAFGATQGRHEYYHMRVFLDDEDVDEFDKEYKYHPFLASLASVGENPTLISKIAKTISESADREEQIRYLLILYRGFLDKETQSDKVLLAALKQKQTYEDYIAKLHEKMEQISKLSSNTSP